MGKIIDAGTVVEVKFPYIKLAGGYNGEFQGCWYIDGSHNNTIDSTIWKPGTYAIGCFEESEGYWGYLTAVTKEIYDAKVNHDQEAWKKIISDPTWHKHLDSPGFINVPGEGYKHVYTERQLSIAGISDEDYQKACKLIDIKKDLGDAISDAEDQNYDDLLKKVTDVYNKYFPG